LNLDSDDTVILCNHGKQIESHVRGVEMFRKLLDYCDWGDNVGLVFPQNVEPYLHHGTLICSKDFPYSVRGKYECPAVMEDKKDFANIPYYDRQFILMVKDEQNVANAYDQTGNINFIFSCDDYPKDITFPFGHPQPNTLYFAHPLRSYYIPLEDASVSLFYERIQEMSRLMQCLGAETITLRCVKGDSISEGMRNATEAGVGGHYHIYHLEGGYRSSTDHQSYQTRENEMSEVRHFNPTAKPYCPDDLIWAAVDPDLNSLVKQRLEGGLLKFSKRVSTKETMAVSNSRLKEIKAAFDVMIASISANYNKNTDASFAESNETLWEISVEFKPLHEIGVSTKTDKAINDDAKQVGDGTVAASSQSPSPALQKSIANSSNEENYIEEYLQCLAEGEITSAKIRLLKRLAISLGISEERAKELESLCNTVQLTDAEKQYLEEFKACLEDEPEISASTRRLLNRLSASLDLTQDQVSRLEKM